MAYRRDHYGAWYDSIVEAIPSNTIVGKAFRGDIGGATTSFIKFAASKTPTTKPPIQPTGGGAGGPGLFDPGGFVAQNQTVLLLVAAGLAVYLVTQRKSGRRR